MAPPAPASPTLVFVIVNIPFFEPGENQGAGPGHAGSVVPCTQQLLPYPDRPDSPGVVSPRPLRFQPGRSGYDHGCLQGGPLHLETRYRTTGICCTTVPIRYRYQYVSTGTGGLCVDYFAGVANLLWIRIRALSYSYIINFF